MNESIWKKIALVEHIAGNNLCYIFVPKNPIEHALNYTPILGKNVWSLKVSLSSKVPMTLN